MIQKPQEIEVQMRAFTEAEAREFKMYLQAQEGVEEVRRPMRRYASAVHIVPFVIFIGKCAGKLALGYTTKLAQDWATEKWKQRKARTGEQIVIYRPDGGVARVVQVLKKKPTKC